MERSARLIPQYVDQLCREVEYTGAIARELGLRLESAYIGGGTPTTLNPEQLTRLITTVQQTWDLSHCREFTVEAGRPDTIDRPKLEALRACGISRISINPQTLNDHVLEVIGRRHSAQQTIEAYELARQLGFDNINMDLIAGLPDDTAESFAATLDRILELDPENITVHSLALKHSARMIQQEDVERFHNDGATAAAMLEYADEKLTAAGYAPYYLYRQSRMVGTWKMWAGPSPARNVTTTSSPWTKPTRYWPAGRGQSSKIKDPGSDFLRRIFNFKYSYEYCSRNGEILARKDEVKTLYEQFANSYFKYVNHLEEINDAALSNPQQMIEEVEDAYHNNLHNVARQAIRRRCRILMLSGPSSSGKTTTAHMLQRELRKMGVDSVIVSMDNFYLGAGQAPILPDGTYDYESVDALDVPAAKSCLSDLLKKGRCDMRCLISASAARQITPSLWSCRRAPLPLSRASTPTLR